MLYIKQHQPLSLERKKTPPIRWGFQCGGRGRSRTCDRLVRSQVLYPAELRALISYILYLSLKIVNFRSSQPLFIVIKVMAERERFELSNGFKAVTPLAGERLRPLGHLSNTLPFYCQVPMHLIIKALEKNFYLG